MFKTREWIKLALFLGLVHAIAGEDVSDFSISVFDIVAGVEILCHPFLLNFVGQQ